MDFNSELDESQTLVQKKCNSLIELYEQYLKPNRNIVENQIRLVSKSLHQLSHFKLIPPPNEKQDNLDLEEPYKHL